MATKNKIIVTKAQLELPKRRRKTKSTFGIDNLIKNVITDQKEISALKDKIHGDEPLPQWNQDLPLEAFLQVDKPQTTQDYSDDLNLRKLKKHVESINIETTRTMRKLNK